jgi:hypothetical protein
MSLSLPLLNQFIDGNFQTMSSLREIVAAADALPPHQQRKLLEYLSSKLARPVATKTNIHERAKDFC